MINDDDPTQSLPDKDKTTQPTVGAILERMQGFEARISQHLQLLETQIALLREQMTTQIASLRDEMNTQFLGVNNQIRLLSNKIDVLNEDSLSLRASQRELLKRMGEIESRAS
jgi:hypothetical protein